jgi:hypothetical protein
MYYNVDIKNGVKRSRFTMFGEVRSSAAQQQQKQQNVVNLVGVFSTN